MNTEISDKDYAAASRAVIDADKTRGTPPDQEFFDTLTSFVYVLLRDHMTAGQVEAAVSKVLAGESVLFVNGLLAQYADGLATRLKSHKVNALAEAIESAFTDDSPLPTDKQSSNNIAHLGDDLDELEELQCVAEEAIAQATAADIETDDTTEPDDPTRNLDCGLKTESLYATRRQEAQHQYQPTSNSAPTHADESSELMREFNTRESIIGGSDIKSNIREASYQAHKDARFKADGTGIPATGTVRAFEWDAETTPDTSDVAEEAASWDESKDDYAAASTLTAEKIAASLGTLEDLKGLLPTDTIAQVVDILKQEVEAEMVDVTAAVRAETETRPTIDVITRGDAVANLNTEGPCKEDGDTNITLDDYRDKKHKFLDTMIDTGATRDEAEGYWEMVEQHEATPPTSRGALGDVASGAAFPEALDEMFPDEHAQKLKAEASLRKQIKLQATIDLAGDMIDGHAKYADVDVKEASLDILEDMERVQDMLGMSSISRMRTAFKNQASNDAALRTMDAGATPFKRVK